MDNHEGLTIKIAHREGYGAPDDWVVSAVTQNRLLERIECDSELYAGQQSIRLEQKWAPKAGDLKLDEYPLYTPLCSHCGGDEALTSCCERQWCKRPACVAGMELYKAQYSANIERVRKDSEAERENWRTGYHAMDGWYFTRLPNGDVRVAKPDAWASIVLPPNIWASVVCSVSKEGENLARWNAAQDFHGKE